MEDIQKARSEVIYFFSSRRRHTRCLSDWSSDVCSSDLIEVDRLLCTTATDLLALPRYGDRDKRLARTAAHLDLAGRSMGPTSKWRSGGSYGELRIGLAIESAMPLPVASCISGPLDLRLDAVCPQHRERQDRKSTRLN